MIARIVVLLVLVSTPAYAQSAVEDADRATIIGVIQGQMAAFRADEAGEAFSYATPGIQRLFGTPERFMAMVRSGYQPVYRPREVEFRELRDTAEGPVQSVFVVGPDGVPVVALYIMQQQADGSWRIAGCVLTPADDTVI